MTIDQNILEDKARPYYSYRVWKILDEGIYGAKIILPDGTHRYDIGLIDIFESLSLEVMEYSPVDRAAEIGKRILRQRQKMRLGPT